MYKIGICDDGKNVCSSIEDMLLQYAKINGKKLDVEVWYSGEGLCSYLVQKNQLDILFLDIELVQMSGIEVGNFIRNQLENRNMQIVYISSHVSYAQQLFKTQPAEFLVKPVTQEMVNDVMELMDKLFGNYVGIFEFRKGKEFYHVPFKDILYFVSDGKKVKVITASKEEEFYGKLKEIMKSLPKEFIAIHQSFIVNKKYVLKYAYDYVEMLDGMKLTISKVNRKTVRQSILQEV